MPRQSLELVPDQAGREAVRALWQRLSETGLPSQADHRAQSNEVHLTLVEAEDLTGQLARARGSLLPLLPLELPVTGATVLGVRRLAAVLTLEVPSALTTAVEALRAGLDVPPDHVWLPHVTLARQLDAQTASRVLAAVGRCPSTLTFTELRHWDPASRTLQTLR